MSDSPKKREARSEMIVHLQSPELITFVVNNMVSTNHDAIERKCNCCNLDYHWCVYCDGMPEWIARLGYCSQKCLAQDYEGTIFKNFEDWSTYVRVRLCPKVTVKTKRNSIFKPIPSKGS
jgi:hypothetical protein